MYHLIDSLETMVVIIANTQRILRKDDKRST